MKVKSEKNIRLLQFGTVFLYFKLHLCVVWFGLAFTLSVCSGVSVLVCWVFFVPLLCTLNHYHLVCVCYYFWFLYTLVLFPPLFVVLFLVQCVLKNLVLVGLFDRGFCIIVCCWSQVCPSLFSGISVCLCYRTALFILFCQATYLLLNSK